MTPERVGALSAAALGYRGQRVIPADVALLLTARRPDVHAQMIAVHDMETTGGIAVYQHVTANPELISQLLRRRAVEEHLAAKPGSAGLAAAAIR